MNGSALKLLVFLSSVEAKILLELSKYNSLEGEQIQELPAITEIDELIKNAKLYK